MLVGVKLPITSENVREIDAYNLMRAHEMFLQSALDESRTILNTYRDQYLICNQEIYRRLCEFDQNKNLFN